MDDILALHRSKLESDRQALRTINTPSRSPIVPSRHSMEAQKNTPARRLPVESPPHVGLQLGGYERHQKHLRAQANMEYNQFLAAKNRTPGDSPLIAAANNHTPRYPRGRVQSPRTRVPSPRKPATPKKESPRHQPQQSPPENDENLEEAYRKLMERKREIEKRYRAQLGDFPTTKENDEKQNRRVYFEGDDGLSHAVKRLEQLSSYDKELEQWNNMRSGRVSDRGVRSAREQRPSEVQLTAQDRSKSVPAAKEPVPVPPQLPNRKQQYAEELRRQMEEQRKAKLRERKEYFSPAKPANNNSPLIRAEQEAQEVRRNLGSEFAEVQDRPRAGAPARPALKRSSPGRAPPSPLARPSEPRLEPRLELERPEGRPPYYGPPPVQPYMYPYMYPGYPPMAPPNYMQGMVPPQMMPAQGGQPPYDPYQFYGLERRRSSESRHRPAPPPQPEVISAPQPQQQNQASPAVTRVGMDQIGMNEIGMNNSPRPAQQRGTMDPLDYAKELRRQVEEKERERERAKRKQEDQDKKWEEEAANYNPWGRGGAGAPLKDSQGNAVADRHMMKQNAQDPILLQKDQQSRLINQVLASPGGVAGPAATNASPRQLSGEKHFGRVAEITGNKQEEDPVKIAAKNDYKSFLQQQIEERARLKEQQREAERLEDEREAERVEQERLRLKAEYERELQEKREKEEAQKKMNEELKRAAEERRHEQERKAAEARRAAEEAERRAAEEARRAREVPAPPPAAAAPVQQQQERSSSPPIPTLANTNRAPSPPLPTHRPASPAAAAPVVVPPLLLAAPHTPVRQSPIRQSPARQSPARQASSRGEGSDDVTRDHVMNQLSALRAQLNRLQTVKREQGKTSTDSSGFETPLERTAKRRTPVGVFREIVSEMEEDISTSLQIHDRDSLDGQCSSEFVACSPEPSQILHGRRSTQNNRYKARPPSSTSTLSFDVHKVAERNEERLRRLENMYSTRVLKEQSPDLILDAFLSEQQPGSEDSLECDTSYKPVD